MSEKMIFCLGDGNYESKGEGYQKNNRIFNVDVTPDEFDTAKNAMPNFKLPIAKWVEYKDLDKDDQTTTSKQRWMKSTNRCHFLHSCQIVVYLIYYLN